MSLAIDTTALHIAGLFYASALAASVTRPLALVAARPSYTSDQFLLRDNSSNAQRAKKFRFIRWSVCKTAPFLAAQPYRSPCVRLRTYFAPSVRHPGWRPWAYRPHLHTPAPVLRFDRGLATAQTEVCYLATGLADPLPSAANPGGILAEPSGGCAVVRSTTLRAIAV
jgi:hypothetical protein